MKFFCRKDTVLADRSSPRHEQIQFVGSRIFAQIRQLGQQEFQVCVGIQAVCFGRLNNGVHDRTGICALGGIAEQPCFTALDKRADRVLSEVI